MDEKDEFDYGPDAGAGLDLSDADFGRGLLQRLNVDAQLTAFREVLNTHEKERQRRRAELDDIAAHAERTSDVQLNEHLVEEWGAELQASLYQDAIHANAVVAMLAPLLETLFKEIFNVIREHQSGKPSAKQQRDPGCKTNGASCGGPSEKAGIVGRLVASAVATGFYQNLPGNFGELLKALFAYRNSMLHEGLEWSTTSLAKFERSRLGWPPSWFETADRAEKPAFFFASKGFVEECMHLVESIVIGLGEYVRTRNEAAR